LIRVLANEKVTTAKVKLFESKVKDMKTVAQNTTSTEEKYKFKISSLEKTNDFLKMKSQDVEKKLALEQDKNLNLSKKLEKLQQKFTQLEKSQRDLLDKPSQSIEKSQDENLAGSEKPLEIVDLNSSHPKPEETEEKDDEKSHPVAADKKVS
jgi:predicted transcriptional regulator